MHILNINYWICINKSLHHKYYVLRAYSALHIKLRPPPHSCLASQKWDSNSNNFLINNFASKFHYWGCKASPIMG